MIKLRKLLKFAVIAAVIFFAFILIWALLDDSPSGAGSYDDDDYAYYASKLSSQSDYIEDDPDTWDWDYYNSTYSFLCLAGRDAAFRREVAADPDNHELLKYLHDVLYLHDNSRLARAIKRDGYYNTLIEWTKPYSGIAQDGWYPSNPVLASDTASGRYPSIKIVNNTGYRIYSAWVSPSDSMSWGEDILQDETLRRGRSVTHQLSESLSRVNRYDIMLEDEDGDTYTKWEVRLSDNAEIVFTIDDIDYDDMYSSQSYSSHSSSSQGSTSWPSSSQSSSTSQSAPASQPSPVSQPAVTTQSTAQQPKPPEPQQAASPTSDAVRSAIVNAAQKYIGAVYVYGAQLPPTKFDCSGLVSQAYKDATKAIIPRSSAEIWSKGKRLTRNELRPGDIIVYNTSGSGASHVAIYVDETYMIHSASAGNPTGVILSRQSESYWAQRVMGYCTFVGVSLPATRNTLMQMPYTDFAVELTRNLQSGIEPLPVQAGSGLSFIITNNTGSNGQFTVQFHKTGASGNNGDSETFSIRKDASRETRIFMCEEAGQYRLEIANKSNNKILFERTYTAVQ